MKSTGIARKIDVLGRVVLPIELRNTLHIQNGDPVEIYVEGRNVILQKYERACVFCETADDLHFFKDKYVCEDCISKLKG